MRADPRLDARGALHSVMIRGLERCALFRDARARANVLSRPVAMVQRTLQGRGPVAS